MYRIRSLDIVGILLPPFQVIRLSSIVHLHVDVNEYIH
jgi:hypothetical protein